MSTLPGVWDLDLTTPIGTLHVQYRFERTADGFTGSATSAKETVPLLDVAVDGEHVTWSQRVTKPMRLNLEFDVVIQDGVMHGHSQAGRLPRTAVTGRQVS
ncbi:hypothetical protein [Cryptosporangium sp. NPDC048952]|uniref:hypothetical protein n=1 Tax=Cryptosporangium sp. NPDC048952 TaxID=3363961 RepID=UPI003720F4B5